MNDVRCHAFFSGRVQGVGFRWTTRQLALRHRLRGWVRNLADGRVELEAEGEPAAIEAFFLDLRTEFSGLLRQVERAGLPAGGTDQDFTIRR